MKRGFLNTAKARETIQSPEPSLPDPDSSECIIDISNTDLHKLPPYVWGRSRVPDRRRAVFRRWPRAPDGQILVPSDIRGKEAANGLDLWGATLYDFFHVYRFPNEHRLISISTGSRLAASMRAFGELDTAASEIEWAENVEPAPREVFPKDIGERIVLREQMVWEEVSDHFIMAGKQMPTPLPPPSPTGSLFDKASYPYPWPFTPFSLPTDPLQTHIPLHLLPQRLIVHDPWSLLAVPSPDYDGLSKTEDRFEEVKHVSWEEKQDVLHTYHLMLSPGGHAKAAQGGAQTEEAHLYLSPAHLTGKGNHSVVYAAEWELPRGMLVREGTNVRKMVVPRKHVREVYPFDPQMTVEDQREAEMEMEIDGGEGVGIGLAAEKLDVGEDGVDTTMINTNDAKGKQKASDLTPPTASTPPQCYAPTPPTAKVRVVAKLSIPHDAHLEREACTYQALPAHLSQHWSGYNVVPPLHDPVPATAVVPNFYGYYAPENSNSKPSKDSGESQSQDSEEEDSYLSPIMLLEDCGTPIDVETLSLDDRQECAALLFRLHCTGWLHNSFAPRNILAQPAPVADTPCSGKWSFRLIDFGRASDGGETRAGEEASAVRLMHILHESRFAGARGGKS